MKKYLAALGLLLLLLPLLLACDGTPEETLPVGGNAASARMLAKVCDIDEAFISVEVTESDYGMSGPFWVRTSDGTLYRGKDGEAVKRTDIRVGDTVEILYSGQVMMSYPPQIVAERITVQ